MIKRSMFGSTHRPSFVQGRPHKLGAQDAIGGHFVRAIGLPRVQVKIGMMNLVYNMIRLVQLHKRDVGGRITAFPVEKCCTT